MDKLMISPKPEFDITKLSTHLFWDVDPKKLDAERNIKLIIGRVLNYGLLTDWYYIKNYYGSQIIYNVAQTISDLEPKSMTFISMLSNVPKEHFKCYTSIQLPHKHWNF